METALVVAYFGFLFAILLGLIWAFIAGTMLVFRRNWVLAALALIFLFPVFIIWAGIELVAKNMSDEEE